MSYTYELIENGYIIEGKNTRIKQTNVPPFRFPYPGATIEESAQLHIAYLIEQDELINREKTDYENLLARVEASENVILDLILGGM